MSETSSKQLSVLIADDVVEIQHLLREWLTDSGYEVSCVAGATDGSRLLRERHFDLVISDVLMPNGDGLELIERFRRTVPGGRILAISGGGKYMPKDACVNMATSFGAHAAVEKPFTRAELFAGIDRALQPQALNWPDFGQVAANS